MNVQLDAGPLDGAESFWRSEGSTPGGVERVLPSGRAQVVVDLDTGRGVLVGPRTVAAEATPPTNAVGFSLDGTGLFRILGPDACHLVDTAVDLDDLGCGDLTRLADARIGASELSRLAHELLRRFDVDPAIVAAERDLRRGGSASGAVALAGVDRRRFVPSFRYVVGVGPKQYERLNRFQRAIRLLRSRRDLDLATIAALASYADQSHLSRETRTLAIATPGELHGLPGPVNHLRLRYAPSA